ncbi:hypothetical protein [Odoribacter lunatus]|uniref:hypothetical protein n=1 Tax=Odoribacter lunatus TaxID=2941335 RepID=UPI0020422412|nr:hypothetical protein [Odoribacter lunatus]
MSFSAVGDSLERSDYYQRVRVFWEATVKGVLQVGTGMVIIGVVRGALLPAPTPCTSIVV